MAQIQVTEEVERRLKLLEHFAEVTRGPCAKIEALEKRILELERAQKLSMGHSGRTSDAFADGAKPVGILMKGRINLNSEEDPENEVDDDDSNDDVRKYMKHNGHKTFWKKVKVDGAQCSEALGHFMSESLPCFNNLSFYQDTAHRRCRIACFCLLLLIFVPYVLWGLYKLSFEPESGAYRNVELEIEPWLGNDAMRAPNPLCMAEFPKGFEVEAKWNIIRNGNFSRKERHVIPLKTMDVLRRQGVAKRARCISTFPDPSLGDNGWPTIEGAFGDPSYRYISLTLRANVNVTRGPRASIIFHNQVGGYNAVNESIFYTFLPRTWSGVEVLLAKKQVITGDRLGVSTKIEHLYKQYVNPPREGLVFDWMYTRTEESYVSNGKQEFATFYIRASDTNLEVQYQPFGIFRMLEDVGGMWTSVLAIAAAVLLLCFCVCRCIWDAREVVKAEAGCEDGSEDDPDDNEDW